MSDKPINDVNGKEPEKIPKSMDQDFIQPTGDNDDPLYQLRQSLLKENTKEEQLKSPDFLRRVSEGFKSRRSETKPKEEEEQSSAPKFGVQTAFLPVFPEVSSKIVKVDGTKSEDIQENFFEQRLGNGPFDQSWRQPTTPLKPEGKDGTAEFDREAEEFFAGARAATDEVQSPFSTSLSRVSSSTWTDSDQETDENPIGYSPIQSVSTGANKVESSPAYFSAERRAPTSGVEKKTQPGSFIAYKPKRTLAQRFRDISQWEKILLMVLLTAILILSIMIGFLYFKSRFNW